MTQCERIVKYMEDFGSITSAETMQDLGVYRLASRICDLKQAGHKIKSVTESSNNRYCEKTRYSRYSFESEGGHGA